MASCVFNDSQRASGISGHCWPLGGLRTRVCALPSRSLPNSHSQRSGENLALHKVCICLSVVSLVWFRSFR